MAAPDTHPDLVELEYTLHLLRAHLEAGPLSGYQAARCARTLAAQALTVAERAKTAAAHANQLRAVS